MTRNSEFLRMSLEVNRANQANIFLSIFIFAVAPGSQAMAKDPAGPLYLSFQELVKGAQSRTLDTYLVELDPAQSTGNLVFTQALSFVYGNKRPILIGVDGTVKKPTLFAMKDLGPLHIEHELYLLNNTKSSHLNPGQLYSAADVFDADHILAVSTKNKVYLFDLNGGSRELGQLNTSEEVNDVQRVGSDLYIFRTKDDLLLAKHSSNGFQTIDQQRVAFDKLYVNDQLTVQLFAAHFLKANSTHFWVLAYGQPDPNSHSFGKQFRSWLIHGEHSSGKLQILGAHPVDPQHHLENIQLLDIEANGSLLVKVGQDYERYPIKGSKQVESPGFFSRTTLTGFAGLAFLNQLSPYSVNQSDVVSHPRTGLPWLSKAKGVSLPMPALNAPVAPIPAIIKTTLSEPYILTLLQQKNPRSVEQLLNYTGKDRTTYKELCQFVNGPNTHPDLRAALYQLAIDNVATLQVNGSPKIAIVPGRGYHLIEPMDSYGPDRFVDFSLADLAKELANTSSSLAGSCGSLLKKQP
ncbi:MAG: hypothetical protein AB1540_08680 [Bdellovibrionota bacterium]